MNKVKAFICIIIPIVLAFAFNTKFGDVPPLLKFLNPFTGFWQNAESNHISTNKNLALKGAKDKIEILFDDQMIPHVFAPVSYTHLDVYKRQVKLCVLISTPLMF